MTVLSTKILKQKTKNGNASKYIFWKLQFRKFFYMIGDRKTDVELAKNLGSDRKIYFSFQMKPMMKLILPQKLGRNLSIS